MGLAAVHYRLPFLCLLLLSLHQCTVFWEEEIKIIDDNKVRPTLILYAIRHIAIELNKRPNLVFSDHYEIGKLQFVMYINHNNPLTNSKYVQRKKKTRLAYQKVQISKSSFALHLQKQQRKSSVPYICSLMK